MWKFMAFLSSGLKDDNKRKIIIAVLLSALSLIIVPIIFVVFILTSPLRTLTSIITDPDMLAIITQFKTEYQYLMPEGTGSGGKGNGEFGWPLDLPEWAFDYSDPTNFFGMRDLGDGARMHEGIDIVTNGQSVPVYAIGNGTVVRAAQIYDTNGGISGGQSGYGNLIIIDHGIAKNGKHILAYYAHLSPYTIKVNVGDTVTRGQNIAMTGTTGGSYGFHLHLGIDADDNFEDPLNYISDQISITEGSSDEIDYLYHCVMAEAGNQPDDGILAVAQVICYRKRVNGGSFYDVINAPGQFEVVENGRINMVTPTDNVKALTDRALRGETVVDPETYFFTADPTGFDSWSTFVTQIGGHYFYK